MAAESTSRTRPPVSTVPHGVTWPMALDPKTVLADPVVLTVGARSHLDGVHDVLTTAAAAAAAGDYRAAVDSYAEAVKVAGTKDPALAGQLRQDVGLLKERLGDAAGATADLEAAQKLFLKADSGEGQVSALAALSGLHTRQGDDAAASASSSAPPLSVASSASTRWTWPARRPSRSPRPAWRAPTFPSPGASGSPGRSGSAAWPAGVPASRWEAGPHPWGRWPSSR